MWVIDESRREFVAKYLADLSKAIFAVALASKLFVELPGWMRMALPLIGVGFFAIAFIFHPKKRMKVEVTTQ